MELRNIPIEDLSNGNQVFTKVIVKNEESDYLELTNTSMFKSHLINLGLKNSKLVNCNINNTVIENCYIRYGQFNNVDFTGTLFKNCDLSKVTIKVCNFRYAEFKNCKLKIDEILGSLPSETNLKIQLLKQLRSNQLSVGDTSGAEDLLIKILDLEKHLFFERALAKTQYYKDNEDISSRIKAFIQGVALCLNDIVWGYGLKLWKLFRTALILIISFGIIIFCFTETDYIMTGTEGNSLIKLNIVDSLYVSYTNFMTLGYGTFIPNSLTSKLIFIVENALGFIFLGFLVSGVYRRVAK